MRNLGFEDTPDYDYLRDLFTQALKSMGEVEDGEYDWMKLNNGKGWEAMKAHPTHHLHAAAAAGGVPNSSARALGGGAGDTQRGGGAGVSTPRGVTADRLNAAQPPPPSPLPGKAPGNAAQAPGKAGHQPSRLGSGAGAPGAATTSKRQSGLAAVVAAPGGDVGTPAASTQAQFQSSTANLPHRLSQITPGVRSPPPAGAGPAGAADASRKPEEPAPGVVRKILRALCCSR